MLVLSFPSIFIHIFQSGAIGVNFFKRPGRVEEGEESPKNLRKLLLLSVLTSEEIMRFGKTPSCVFIACLFYQLSYSVSVSNNSWAQWAISEPCLTGKRKCVGLEVTEGVRQVRGLIKRRFACRRRRMEHRHFFSEQDPA